MDWLVTRQEAIFFVLWFSAIVFVVTLFGALAELPFFSHFISKFWQAVDDWKYRAKSAKSKKREAKDAENGVNEE